MKREREDEPEVEREDGHERVNNAAQESAHDAGGSSAGFAPPAAAGALGSAQFWFYRDASGQEQGPQLTSAMRAWFEAGYFDGVSVAASYYGEVPDAFWPVAELWTEPATQAFLVTDGSVEVQATEEAAPFIPSDAPGSS